MKSTGAVAALMCAAALVACSEDPPAEPTPSTPAATAELNGIYTITTDYPKQTYNGYPATDPQPTTTSTYAFRSACSAERGCVATATLLTADGEPGSAPLVFDLVADQWVSVESSEAVCRNGDGLDWPAPKLTELSFDASADGAPTGTSSIAVAGCYLLETPLTVTRTGDRPTDLEVSDPATYPARVTTSPAASLRGRYRAIGLGQIDGTEPDVAEWTITPVCTRTADRCLTLVKIAARPEFDELEPKYYSYVFEADQWTRTFRFANASCGAGLSGPGSTTATMKLPPAPVPDPIVTIRHELLTTFTGACQGKPIRGATLLNRIGD